MRVSSRGSDRSRARARSIAWSAGGSRRSDASRAGPRLADRHARRRESARGAVRAAIPTPTSSRCSTSRDRCRRHRAASHRHVARAAAAVRANRTIVDYLPLFPAAIEQFDLDGYDLVVSSSHCAAKVGGRRRGARGTSATAIRRCGMRGISSTPTSDRTGSARSRADGCIVRCSRGWRGGTPRPRAASDRFVANSQYVAGRIRRYYNREATIVYPPVDTIFYHPDTTSPGESFSDCVGARPVQADRSGDRSVPARRRAACASSATAPIASDSSSRPTVDVEFLGRVSDEEIRDEYRRALAVLLPGRRRLRHRARRGAGVRTSCGGARARRRTRDRDRRAKQACCSTSSRPASLTAALEQSRHALRPRPPSRPRRAVLPRASCGSDAGGHRRTLAAPAGTTW